MTCRGTAAAVSCPACGATGAVQRWELVDLDERPELAERIVREGLDAARCEACGEPLPAPPGLLLLYRPGANQPLVFSPTLGHPHTADERAALIQALAGDLGPRWRDEWLQRVLVMGRHLLPALLAGGAALAAELDAAFRATAGARNWEQRQGLLQAHPALLEPVAAVAWQQLARAQAGDPARSHGRMWAAILERCAARGIGPGLASLEAEQLNARLTGLYPATQAPGATQEQREQAAAAARRLLELTDARHDRAAWLQLTTRLANLDADWQGETRPQHLEQALAGYQRALDALQPDDPETLRAYLLDALGIAWCQRSAGNRADNLEQAIQALDACLALSGPDKDPERWGHALLNRAVAVSERVIGDPSENQEQAIADLARARQVIDAQDQLREFARLMDILGGLYAQRIAGEPVLNRERAIMAYGWALECWDAEADAHHRAVTCANLAAAYLDRPVDPPGDNQEQALQLAREALGVLTPETDPSRFLTTAVTLCLALADARGELDRAVDLLSDALQRVPQEAGPRQWAEAATRLARLLERRADGADDLGRAVAAYSEALKIYRPDTDPDRHQETQRALGRLQFRHRLWGPAVQAFQAAEAVAPQAQALAFTAAGRRRLLSSAARTAAQAAYALARQGDFEAALASLEAVRARELADSLGRRHPELQRLAREAPELEPHFRQAAGRMESLLAAERQRTLAPVQGLPDTVPEDFAARLAAARSELEQALAAIRARPGLETFLEAPDLDVIADLVTPGRPVAYLAVTPAGALGLVLRRHADTGAVSLLPAWDDRLDSDRLDRLLVRWPGGGTSGQGHYTLSAIDPDEPDQIMIGWEGEMPEGGYLVGQIRDPDALPGAVAEVIEACRALMQAVARLAGTATALALVPAGKLGLLPLGAALPDPGSPPAAPRAVSVLPSARAGLLLASAEAARAADSPALAGVANPLPHGTPLLFAPLEMAWVAERFPAPRRHRIQGFEATREAFLDLLGRGDHLHLACHGQFDPFQPLESRLELAAGESVRLLELLEHQALTRLRLVVLSACQSAVTDSRHLPDEAGSLATAFLAAGVSGVVGSLWPVDDLASALLFRQFYRELLDAAGCRAAPPDAALARAQRWLREVAAGELAELFAAERQAWEQASGHPAPLLLQAARHFAAQPPEHRPFAEPVDWAGFAYLGA